MSPIGAVLLSALIITGMMYTAGNYDAIGFSENAWIAVNILLFCSLIAYEIYAKKRRSGEDKNDKKEN